MGNHPPSNISRDHPSPPYLRLKKETQIDLPGIGPAPVRELMARVRYFAGNRRQDEILGNHRVNVESTAVFCQGVVMTDANQCDNCLQGWGPWAKCVQLEEGEAREGI
ncbi:hypothetical protein N7454_006173 [Penicillium verhagenii]|nr:hypothetical protein N7454_006173 [Penicillium verhagenii]